MNQLYVGFNKKIEYPKGGFLLITDDVPDIPHARVFDPLRHGFNPLKRLEYKRARELADVLYTVYPQGENTLTVRNGRRDLRNSLWPSHEGWDRRPPKPPNRFDRIGGSEEVLSLISDILASPVLKRVLCRPSDFSFNPNFKIIARINRAELGEFDSLVLGLLLMNMYRGQLVIEDFGFYGRDTHIGVIRQERLIAGVNYLGELPEKLRAASLLIEDKYGSGTNYDDAVTLARYAGKVPQTKGHSDFVEGAMT